MNDVIAIVLFDDVELLDFAGPMQVFLSAQYLYPNLIAKVITIGEKLTHTISKSGASIEVQHQWNHIVDVDILLIPGGFGTRPILKNDAALSILTRWIQHATLTCTVCTGSLILAKLGLLKGLSATTHYGALELMSSLDPTIQIDRTRRFIDHETLIISEGVSAGIDMAFYVVAKKYRQQVSDEVRKYIEYYPEK